MIFVARFIILYIKRFTKNTFFVEKNPTIVNFPVKGIEFGDLLTDEVSQNQFIGSELFLFGSDQLLLNNAGQGQGLILSFNTYF